MLFSLDLPELSELSGTDEEELPEDAEAGEEAAVEVEVELEVDVEVDDELL